MSLLKSAGLCHTTLTSLTSELLQSVQDSAGQLEEGGRQWMLEASVSQLNSSYIILTKPFVAGEENGCYANWEKLVWIVTL